MKILIVAEHTHHSYFLVWLLVFIITLAGISAGKLTAQNTSGSPVSTGPDGRMIYTSTVSGDRIPDFSYCGYMAGEQPIPEVPIRIVVPLKKGDATLRIQSALDYVASLPVDKNGFRGTVLLEKGNYNVSGSLKINASGVVLRGTGMGEDGTILTGTGLSRETLIVVFGKNGRKFNDTIPVAEEYIPVNATKIIIASTSSLKAGDEVLIHRPSTQRWIEELKMQEFGGETGWLGWKPGERDIYWDRKIIAMEGDQVTLDAPITTALDSAYGGGNIIPFQWPGRIEKVGIENLVCKSTYDENNPKDEEHRWMGITMENVQDAWVRQVIFKHFAGSAVAAYETSKRITVEDCKSLSPVSEIGGQRRYSFFTSGQQTLFQRLYAEYGYHDFAVGFMASLNAFVQCGSHLPYSFSGAIDSWASGVLFDIVNVDGQELGFPIRGQDAQGTGWTAANSVLWQCSAAKINCYGPPTANNWAFGSWSQFAGNGYWGNTNDHISPRSLYYAQLKDRLEKDISAGASLLPTITNSTSSPTVDQAAEMTARSVDPPVLLSDWIDRAPLRNPISTDASGIKTIDEIKYQRPLVKPEKSMCIKNGWLVCEDAVLTGRRQDVQWWRGNTRYYEVKKARPHITRFVPGRTGPGFTDDLNKVTDEMIKDHTLAMDHNYGLWYDRRRDDHERVRRMDGEVWPPFYELPFARSGQGTAWDGLSKYDLTKYNHWYWNRLKQFADLADQKGLILIHQNYFQHNILEAGAHWADFPWRSANNINNTGFPEPPPYAGDKRIFMSGQFYDVTHPVRRELHRAFIRQCLENFSDNRSVIQSIGAEFSGPLHFVQFWIDTILEWEKVSGKNENIALSVTKDVQDSILADPERASAIDLIDIRYWHYREDGSTYAPKGGQHLAPRQYARLVKSGKSSFESVHRAVREYREKYPGKAVIYSFGGYDKMGWAVLMAGGSLAEIPEVEDPGFLKDAMTMFPVDLTGNPKDQWALGNADGEYIVYDNTSGTIELNLRESKKYFKKRWIDPENGRILKGGRKVKGGKIVEAKSPQHGPVILWMTLIKE